MLIGILVNPLSPHDALKHHFTCLKTDIIFLQSRVLERKFPETGLPIHGNLLKFLNHLSSHLHPLQVVNCDSNSRLVVDEDDNGKFRLEKGKCRAVLLVRSTSALHPQHYITSSCEQGLILLSILTLILSWLYLFSLEKLKSILTCLMERENV